jgi:hypothetical protein
MAVDLSTTVLDVKQKLAERMEEAPSVDKFILRNPKCDDMGEVLTETMKIDECRLYD